MPSFTKLCLCLGLLVFGALWASGEDQPSPLQILFKEYKEDTTNVLDSSDSRKSFYQKWIDRFEGRISSQASKNDPGLLQVLSELVALKYAANDQAGAVETARYIINKYSSNPVSNYEKVNLATMLFYINQKNLGNQDVTAAFARAYAVLDTQQDILVKADFFQKYISVLQFNKEYALAETVSAAFLGDLTPLMHAKGAAQDTLFSLLTWTTQKHLELDVLLGKVENVKTDLGEALKVNGLIKAHDVIEAANALFTRKEDVRQFIIPFIAHFNGREKNILIIAVAKSFQKDAQYAMAAKYYSDCLQGFDLSDSGIAAMDAVQIKSLKEFAPDLILCLQREGMEKEADELSQKYLNPKIKEE